ncbi:MAG: VWA domain-containing protein [Fuerstiella sp.]|jgi:Ca-activated chloride channel family protein|nr:VWA domain-containing protein [Fuerstiella sp.]MCP4506773.1 VWA domain-containing protein [Fuerstiella sp.]MDG2128995.1 VWA domain-containing protein [Fuerstiella sp.]
MKNFSVMTLMCLLGGGALADTHQVRLDVSPVYSVLKSGQKQTTWIRVGLAGFKLESDRRRAGVNLAIVMDKSGSMQGEKIKRAREAAIDAIKLLSPDDIVSIITYDSTVNVLVPSTKLTDKQAVITAINGIASGGNTALFAGVSKGAAEVRKFLDRERVNRVILLSDGLANVGPSSPGELGSLGKSLIKENISVSTLGLGLGYNEDLMVQLAGASGGNHLFIEDASELVDIFRREFDDVLSVVAQEVDVRISIPKGIRPVRVLGNDADINGQDIVTRLAQIYSEQDKYVIVEVELAAAETGSNLKLATVSVTYANMKTHESDKLSGGVRTSFSDNDKKVAASLNHKAMADVVALFSSEQNKLATKFLDEGDLMKCRQILKENVDYLNVNAMLCPTDSLRLKELAKQNGFQLEQLQGVTSNQDVKANLARKSLRYYQNAVDVQQRASNAPTLKDK